MGLVNGRMIETFKTDIGSFLWAAQNGDVDTLQLELLQDDKKILETVPTSRRSALMLAAMNGHVDCVKVLMKHEKPDINVRDKKGRTALMHASCNGHVDCVNALMEHERSDVNGRDDGGRTALMFASRNGHVECVTVLMEHEKSDVNIYNKWGVTALICATYYGHVDCVKVLMEDEKIDVNLASYPEGRTALMDASKKGYVDIVKMLMDHEKIDVNIADDEGYTALINASGNGHVECVKVLMENQNIDVNIRGKNDATALMDASCNGHVDCVKVLMEREQIDVNARDTYGMTAFLNASFFEHFECVKVLMEHEKTDVNACNNKGKTALLYASNYGIVDFVKMLMENEKIDLNACNIKGRTALMIASYNGYFKCVNLLMENEKLDVNAVDNEGKTAFMMAMEESNIKCLQYFFQITVLTDFVFVANQNKHAHKEVLSNTLYYDPNDGCAMYIPGITWRSPYIYGRDQNKKSILKLNVRSGLHRCVLCFLLNGSDVAMSENGACNHSDLEKIQCCVWDKDRRMELLSLAPYYKGNFKGFEYCIQFHRIRFHMLVVLFQETIGKSDTISLALYKRLCSLIQDSTDIDIFLHMLCNGGDVGESLDFLLSVYVWQIVSRIAHEERIPRTDLFDNKVLFSLADHINDKQVLRRFLTIHPPENPSQEFRFIIALISINAGVFFWKLYPGLSSVDKRVVLQQLVTKDIAPENFPENQGTLSSPMHDAFMCRDDGLLRYLVANFYFAPRDFDLLQGEDINCLIFDQNLSSTLSRLYLEHVKPPWRLEKLSILALSKWLRDNRRRGDDNKVLNMLPEMFRSRLVANNPIQLIDVNQWERIDLDFLNHRLMMPINRQTLFQDEQCSTSGLGINMETD